MRSICALFTKLMCLGLLLALGACSDDGSHETKAVVSAEPVIVAEATLAAATAQGSDSDPQTANDDAARLLVHKSETCGCCALWVDYMAEEGFAAEVQTEVDMGAVKDRLGVPEKFRSCHTAVSRNGYVFEGHVPSIAVRRFLKNPPKDALGLAVPGMPVGSPGMEVDNQFQPYQIMLLKQDGSAVPYGHVSNYESQFSEFKADNSAAPGADLIPPK